MITPLTVASRLTRAKGDASVGSATPPRYLQTARWLLPCRLPPHDSRLTFSLSPQFRIDKLVGCAFATIRFFAKEYAMNPELKNSRILILDAFVDRTRAQQLSHDLHAYFESAPLFTDGQCPNSPAVYNFLPMMELLVEKLPDVSVQAGARLFPTFCYARSYTRGERLAPHRDRPASEVAVTVHLEGDESWSIYFGHALTGVREVCLKPGQAVLYLGCEVTHWREEFTGKFYRQTTLHYVRSRGKYAAACFDTRTPEINGIRY